MVNIIGKKFGHWTPLKRIKGAKHICKCDVCSKTKAVFTKTLLDGKSRSCMPCSRLLKRQETDKRIIGDKFGRLTAIKRAYKNKRSEWYWVFNCDCGTKNHITKMGAKSCGCSRIKLLMGMKFGKLTVLRLNPIRRRKQSQWDCICDCGNLKTVIASDLKTGSVRSCGCLIGTGHFKNFTGERRGKLTIIKLSKNRTNDGSYKWICKCDCGQVTEVNRSNLRNTYSCGCISKDYIEIMKNKDKLTNKDRLKVLRQAAKANRQQAELGDMYNLNWEETTKIMANAQQLSI